MSQKDKEGILFSTEEMNNIMADTMKFSEDKPETIFGMTFKNAEERRAYFREELRKKLPELKKIEGFPIGSDEDILNLSDPPYYTACPNPWLNQFVEEWEKEKIVLENEGKRSKDFEVKEPYASDVSEGKNNPIYMAHAYHTKVPHPAIMRYILHYTQPGDIVFDGFAGTGMTGVAANLCGSVNDVSALKEKNVKIGARHGICSDLSPIATLISANYNLPFDVNSFEKKATAILEQVEQELGWMYETEVQGIKGKINYVVWSDVFSCPSCGGEIVLWNESVNLEKQEISSEFLCPHCGTKCTKKNMNKIWETAFDSILQEAVSMNKKVPVLINYMVKQRCERVPTEDDLRLIDSIDYGKKLYRTTKLVNGFNTSQPINSNGICFTHQFFTKRNFIYLSRFKELLVQNNMPLVLLTSVLQNASKMYKFRIDRKGGILNGTLFVPSLNIEQNPYNLLKNKIKDFVKTQYSYRGHVSVSLNSATSLRNLGEACIDYIFIDPPFGANIMYSELSLVWESWIGVRTNNKEETIVNDYQKKSLSEYQVLMKESLTEFYRLLKSGKWLTIEFSNTSAAVWCAIQNALQGVGFVIASVSALDKKQGSFKAVTTTTAVKQDLVITCYKPSIVKEEKVGTATITEANVWEFTEEYLEHLPVVVERNMKTTSVIERSPKIINDRMVSFFVQQGLPVPLDAKEFQQGLRERFVERDGMFFTAAQAAEYEEKKKSAPEFVPMGIIVSDEANGIQWLKNQLRNDPKTYQEIQPEWMQAINGVRKHDILPELKQLLEENFIEMEDGKWRLPNIQDDVDKEALRTKALLREFKIYVEQASKPKGKIKEARVEALRAGFKDCYVRKDFKTIVMLGDKIPQNLRDEDDVLLQFYDIAQNKI